MSSSSAPRTTYLIGRLDRIVRRSLEDLLRDQEVTVLGYTALTVLAARPGLSNAQLARRSFMTPQGMNQALAVLTEGGFVRRKPDKQNRRIQRIELTARGRRVVEECAGRVEQLEEKLLSSLSQHERSELNSLLQTIVNDNRRH